MKRPGDALERAGRTPRRLTGAELLAVLYRGEALLARFDRQLVVDVAPDAVDLADLGASRQLAGLDVGQIADLRWPLDDGRGLHLHVTVDGRYRLHLDRVCALRRPLGHLWADTALARALACASLLAMPSAVCGAWAAGAILLAGAAVGACRPRRRAYVVRAPDP